MAVLPYLHFWPIAGHVFAGTHCLIFANAETTPDPVFAGRADDFAWPQGIEDRAQLANVASQAKESKRGFSNLPRR